MCNSELRNVEEIPPLYRSVFNAYPCFNAVQTQVLDDVLYTDNSVVVSAPTGAGKTVIFELAIVRLLIQYENVDISQQLKMVYICPIKSLCQERLIDWHKKFSKFGVNCISITGDSDNVDFQHLINHNLIVSTPEKWDSLTRRWRDNEKMVKVVKLFMIDEVHLLNEENRGSTLEVIVSRMKTVENSVTPSVDGSGICNQKIRFIALSATVPNVEDISEWIGKPPNVKYYRFSEEMRPVKLKKIILGYNCSPKTTPFKFDMSLSYKLRSLLMQYSEGKPTLIFCSTRKSVEMTANHIVQGLKIHLTPEQVNKLTEVANLITDTKTKATLKHGVGYHHAGLIPETRHLIEDLFRNGDLPVLVTTSTLAMGVNLPAHLVIIKSTKCYDNCGFRDYTETAIHQMIGRAGRPQFDTSATALILTTNDDKHKFEQMVGCGQPIESNLHRHLTEHLNAEVVLGTITDLDVGLQWLASTFLYVRARKNPRYYGLNVGLSKDQIDKKLLDICQIDLNKLVTGGMITMDQNIIITPTRTGQIMAKYYVAFETMKLFTQIAGTEILIQILALVSKCHEFSEMRLRVNDKKALNLFNKNANRATIRFPLNGKIKTWYMKVNCIIQAVLGNLDIQEQSLLSESFTIMRNGSRIAKCLVEYLGTRKANCYSALLNTVILGKCFNARLWENSPYVSKQLSGIGNVMSKQLVNAGKTSFQKILTSNPRDLEMIIKRKPPMGNLMIEEVEHIPRYEMTLEKVDGQKQLKLAIKLVNCVDVEEKSTVDVKSVMTLLVGNSSNEILVYEKYQHSYMIENNEVIKFIRINTDDLEEVNAHFISEDWVGFDCASSVTFRSGDRVTEKNTVSDGKDVKKAPTYIQMFLDMYMKTKKKGTEVVQKKQKVRKDDTSQAGEEATKNPKKLSKETNTNTSGEGKNPVENSSVMATAELKHTDTNKQIQPQNGDGNVADKYTDMEYVEHDKTSSPSGIETNEQAQDQAASENVRMEVEHRVDVVPVDQVSNTSSSSLFSNKPDTIMENTNVNMVYEAVEEMEADDTSEENGEEMEDQLVIDEGPASAKNVIDFNEKVYTAPSLFHLSLKYNVPTHQKRKMPLRAAGPSKNDSSSQSQNGDAQKRPALEAFKFPNKKKINHRLDLEDLPDSTDNTPHFPATNPLQPSQASNTNRSRTNNTLSDNKRSSQNEANKENAQKGITWRSPLVYSPAAKHSPKMSFPSSRVEHENDTSNGTANETFDTTSSKSSVNLTLNIQPTPRRSKSSARSTNKKRGTNFPLSDKDYSLDNDPEPKEGLDALCSRSLIAMLGLDKVGSKAKKVGDSPTYHYYSQLLSQPVQSQKQNTETTPQRERSDDKTYEENVSNDLETSNAWDTSNLWDYTPQNNSGDLECETNFPQGDYPGAPWGDLTSHPAVADSSAAEKRRQAQNDLEDLQLYHRSVGLVEDAAPEHQQNSSTQSQWDYQRCESSAQLGYRQQSNPASFAPPNLIGDSNFAGHAFMPPRKTTETYVSHNYPGPYSAQDVQFPIVKVSPEHVDFMRPLAAVGGSPKMSQDNVRRSSEYFEKSGFTDYGLGQDREAEFTSYGRLQPPTQVNRTDTASYDAAGHKYPVYTPRKSVFNNESFGQVVETPKRGNVLSQTNSQNFTQEGYSLNGSPQNGAPLPMSQFPSRRGKRAAKGNVSNRPVAKRTSNGGAEMLNRSLSFDQPPSSNRENALFQLQPVNLFQAQQKTNHLQEREIVHNRPSNDAAEMLNRSLSFDQPPSSNRENALFQLQPVNLFQAQQKTNHLQEREIVHNRPSNDAAEMLNRSLSFNQLSGLNKENAFFQQSQAMKPRQEGELNSYRPEMNPYQEQRAMNPYHGQRAMNPYPGQRAMNPYPGQRAVNPYQEQQGVCGNQVFMMNPGYAQRWGLPPQNMFSPRTLTQGMPPYLSNNRLTYPYAGQCPPYYPNYALGIPNHDKQYMMDKYLQSMGRKKK